MNKDFVYKERDAGNKELFSMLIYRPIAKIMVLRAFKFINISPNIISIVSLLWVVVASIFFAFFTYPSIIIGALFLQLSYLFDVLDGQYARYKGMSTKFGQWLDPFLDTIKIVFLFISLSFGAFKAQGDPGMFVWGAIAMANSFLTFYIMNTRDKIIKSVTFEVKLAKNIYVGYEISLYLAVTLAVLFNKAHWALVFLATIGALSWIKVLATLIKYYAANKKLVEG